MAAIASDLAWAEPMSLGIESMRSHQYSVGIFVFMMISMALFVGIIIGYMKGDAGKGMKTGERVLLLMIGLGVAIAAVFAAVQLLDGFLF